MPDVYVFEGSGRVGEIMIDDKNDVFFKFAEMTNNEFLLMSEKIFHDNPQGLSDMRALRKILNKYKGQRRDDYVKNEIAKLGFKYLGKKC